MSLTIDTQTLAGLVTSYGRGAVQRVTSPDVRAIVRETVAQGKRDAVRRMEDRARAFNGYAPEDNCMAVRAEDMCNACRACALKSIHWPRAREIRNVRAVVRELIRAHTRRIEPIKMTLPDYHDAIIREARLTALLALAYRRAGSVGHFPISRADMRVNHGTLFTRSAFKRHFTFTGGRDAATVQIEPADIVQGAFIRALESGDAVNGVPTYGALFRHIQAERASLTREELARRAAFMRVMNGDVPAELREWPDATDTHSMRLIGTRNYATLDQHRQSLADMRRDDELANVDDAVTRSARTEVIDGLSDVSAGTFAYQVAALLHRDGVTIDAIAEALNLTTASVIARVHETIGRETTGIDHSMRSADMARESERETEIDKAQDRHARRARRAELDRRIDNYANGRVFPASNVPLSNSAPGIGMISHSDVERGQHVEYEYSADAPREYFSADGWHPAGSVVRVAGVYLPGDD